MIADQSLKPFNTVPGPGNPQAGGFGGGGLMSPALMSDRTLVCMVSPSKFQSTGLPAVGNTGPCPRPTGPIIVVKFAGVL